MHIVDAVLFDSFYDIAVEIRDAVALAFGMHLSLVVPVAVLASCNSSWCRS